MDVRNYLDLRNDVVFKMFFSREKNKPLLISFIEAVIEPSSPIEDVEILNPIPIKELVDDKTSILDLALRLKDKTRIDVEMQVARTQSFRRRILFYWSKLHQSQLQTGDTYQKLSPTISITVLDYNEFPENKDEIHSVFELKERIRGELYSSDIQLHFLELIKYKKWKLKTNRKSRLLEYWTRFFQLTDVSDQELQDLNKEPIMDNAIKALEELSQEPSARDLAEMRERSRINLLTLTEEAVARGEARAKIELIRKANKSGLSIEEIASMFELTIDEIKKALE